MRWTAVLSIAALGYAAIPALDLLQVAPADILAGQKVQHGRIQNRNAILYPRELANTTSTTAAPAAVAPDGVSSTSSAPAAAASTAACTELLSYPVNWYTLTTIINGQAQITTSTGFHAYNPCETDNPLSDPYFTDKDFPSEAASSSSCAVLYYVSGQYTTTEYTTETITAAGRAGVAMTVPPSTYCSTSFFNTLNANEHFPATTTSKVTIITYVSPSTVQVSISADFDTASLKETGLIVSTPATVRPGIPQIIEPAVSIPLTTSQGVGNAVVPANAGGASLIDGSSSTSISVSVAVTTSRPASGSAADSGAAPTTSGIVGSIPIAPGSGGVVTASLLTTRILVVSSGVSKTVLETLSVYNLLSSTRIVAPSGLTAIVLTSIMSVTADAPVTPITTEFGGEFFTISGPTTLTVGNSITTITTASYSVQSSTYLAVAEESATSYTVSTLSQTAGGSTQASATAKKSLGNSNWRMSKLIICLWSGLTALLLLFAC